MGAWGAPLLWLALVLGHGRALPQAARTETHPPLPIRPLFVPPPPGALLYTARCAALRATSGSEGSGCHQAQRTGGGEPQRGVLPSRGLSRALTLTSFSDSYPRLDLWPEREHVFKQHMHETCEMRVATCECSPTPQQHHHAPAPGSCPGHHDTRVQTRELQKGRRVTLTNSKGHNLSISDMHDFESRGVAGRGYGRGPRLPRGRRGRADCARALASRRVLASRREGEFAVGCSEALL
eukprot:COSAG03_NODE_2956_length_2327_cov_60.036355_2_plen_238_part_00